MVVTYRANPITMWMVRWFAKVRYACLLNLLADREIVPELLQENCTPDKLAAALLPLLTDPSAAQALRAAYQPVLETLRPAAGHPSDAAASAVLALLGQS
jgi:lipid-A-disaccharide synthase